MDGIGETLRAVHRLNSDGGYKGWLGFERSAEVVTDQGEVIGRIGWGGNRGTGCVDLSGAGCAMVRDWDAVMVGIARMGGRLTRVDLCCDFLDGAVSVDRAVAAYRIGAFASQGRPPVARLIDDLGSEKGRTLYVGCGSSSKLLRIYEKGRQLGDKASPWVRVECQFKRGDFDLPLAMLVDCATYLAGAYPVLKKWIGVAAEVLHANKHKAEVEVDKALLVARQQVGRTVAFLMQSLGWTASRVIHRIASQVPSDRIVYRGWEGLKQHMDAPVNVFKPLEEYEVRPA